MAGKTVAGTAADPTIKYAKLVVDGKTYSLAYDFNAIAFAESVSPGSNLLEGLRNLRNLTAMQLRGLLHAALLKAHPRMTLNQAGELLRLDTLDTVCDRIAQAYLLSIEKPADPSQPEPRPVEEASAA